MPKLNATVDIGELRIKGRITRDAESEIGLDIALPAGKSGSLTARSAADVGQVDLAAGHGILVGDQVDVYWSGGQAHLFDVSAVNGDVVSIEYGGGDDLPAQGTAVIVSLIVETNNAYITGNLLALLAAECDRRGQVHFTPYPDDGAKNIALAAGELWRWISREDTTNPLSGAVVDHVYCSCGEAQAGTLKIGVAYNT